MTKDKALDLALEALEFFKGLALSIEEIERAEEAITAIKQARALDKKAENARELGLDYEPVFSYTPDMDAVRRAEKEKADKFLGKYLSQPAPVQEPVVQTFGEENGELGFYPDDASNGQQRELVGEVEMGQLVGDGAHKSASNPDAKGEIAVIRGVDEYGPMLDWYEHWVNFPVGTKFYTTPPAAQPAPVPKGMVLLPKRMTKTMRYVTDQEDWAWEDLLAAAEAITEDEYNEIATPPAAQPAPVQEPVAMRMPKVGDKVVCIEDESLGTVVYLTAGGSPEIKFDDGSHGTYMLREFAELFGYTTPPAAQRQWVGLTDEEEVELWESTDSDWELMKRTEAKLKEKNT